MELIQVYSEQYPVHKYTGYPEVSQVLVRRSLSHTSQYFCLSLKYDYFDNSKTVFKRLITPIEDIIMITAIFFCLRLKYAYFDNSKTSFKRIIAFIGDLIILVSNDRL